MVHYYVRRRWLHVFRGCVAYEIELFPKGSRLNWFNCSVLWAHDLTHWWTKGRKLHFYWWQSTT